eukprot:TCALIF_12889-PA protein Name:"Protein of unknown function" AED:0.00 eAED:0.00 QI:86/1/1/1/0/0/3/12/108
MKFVLFLSVAATYLVLCHSQALLKQGAICSSSAECQSPLVCNPWKNGPDRCQPPLCIKSGERCGFFKGRCCTCDGVYCYKPSPLDKTKCTPLSEIPIADRAEAIMFNV